MNWDNYKHDFDKYNIKVDEMFELNGGSDLVKLNEPDLPLNFTDDDWDIARSLNVLNMTNRDNDILIHALKTNWNDETFQNYVNALCSSDMRPNWLRDYSKVPDSIRHPCLNYQNPNTTPRVNYKPLFVDAPNALLSFNLCDNSLEMFVKSQQLDRIGTTLQNILTDVSDKAKEQLDIYDLEAIIQCGGLDEFLKENKDLSMVFSDGVSDRFLTAMITAVNSVEGAEDYIVNRFDGIYSEKSDKDKEIMRQLQSHPLVDDCGHTGGTATWTLYNTQKYFRVGHDSFVKDVLRSRGVKLDNL